MATQASPVSATRCRRTIPHYLLLHLSTRPSTEFAQGMRFAILVLLTLIALLGRSAVGQNQTEIFLLRMPDGFKVGFQKANMAKWVPAGQTVDDWSEMITPDLAC